MSSPLLPTSNRENAIGESNLNRNFKSQIAFLRSLLTSLATSLRRVLSHARPWRELIDRSAFSRPESLSEAASRVRKNFSYFSVNYSTVIALVLAFSFLSHPFSLLLVASLASAWLFLYAFRQSDQPLVVGGRAFSERETLAILCVVTAVVVFFTSVGSLLMSTVTAGLAIVCAHGAFRAPEDLFLDEQETTGSGIFSFINSAAASSAAAAAAAAAPAMVSRV